MTTELRNSDNCFSQKLLQIAQSVPHEGMTLFQLLKDLGESGSLMLCMFLTIPFLLPVSIPGSSIPFGLIIAFIGIGNLANQSPWLPKFLMNRSLHSERLLPVLKKGAKWFAKIEKLTHPRLTLLSHPFIMGRLNGVLLILSGILLMAPLPFPFSNTLPAYAVLFLALGSLERDGLAILTGYLFLTATGIYFTLITVISFQGIELILQKK